MSDAMEEAVRLLNEYHRELSEKAAEEIVEHRETLSAFSYGTGNNVVERYAMELNNVSLLLHHLGHYAGPAPSAPGTVRAVTFDSPKREIDRPLVQWLQANPTARPLLAVPLDQGEEARCILLYLDALGEKED